MSPQTEYINGETIAIDGGQYLADGSNFAVLLKWDDGEWAQARAKIDRGTVAGASRQQAQGAS